MSNIRTRIVLGCVAALVGVGLAIMYVRAQATPAPPQAASQAPQAQQSAPQQSGQAASALASAQGESAAVPAGPPNRNMGEGAGSTIFGDHCESCHDKTAGAPTYAAMRNMTSDHIYSVLSSGSVKAHADEVAKLTDAQLRDIAEWVAERRIGGDHEEAEDMPNRCSTNTPITVAGLNAASSWNGWSPTLTNTRFQSAKAADLSPAEVTRLRLKWAFAFPSAASMYGQPTIAGGRVFVGADNGYVYSLDAVSGCVYWSFRAQAGVSGAVSVERVPGSTDDVSVFFGDTLGNAYAVSASDGEMMWRHHVDDHPLARIRAAVRYYDGRVYVPVASLEEPDSSSAQHPCCTFRGMVEALDAVTGKQIWKTYTIPDAPTQRTTATGVSYWGPSGAGVWGPLTLDLKRKAIYLGTGNGFSEPDSGRSDAIMALSMDTGKVLWVHQNEPGDVWHTGCPMGPPAPGLGLPPRGAGRGPIGANGVGGRGTAPGAAPGRGAAPGAFRQPPKPATYYCPSTTDDPDWDFSSGTILVDEPNGKSLVIAGQKSGMVWAHDADTGDLVWKSDISRGQIVFGGAADEDSAYFATGRAVAAIRLSDGLERWAVTIPAQDSMAGHAGFSAAVSVIPGVLFVPGKDGQLIALSTFDGHQIWAYDTTQEVTTVNGVNAKGGSIGSAGATIVDGMVFVPSGYTGFQGGQKGNLLLAFGPPSN
jgi:polyvinyl alcohol dehydrogenase (cytochrome)